MTKQESPKFGRKSPMAEAFTADAYVGRASAWSKALVKSTGRPVKADPYSAVADMVRRATGANVPASKICTLARKPRSLKSICGSIHDALARTYAAECARQRKLLAHEQAIAEAIGIDTPLTRAAARLAGHDADCAVDDDHNSSAGSTVEAATISASSSG